MSDPFSTLDPLPWRELILPLSQAEDALARLDERLRASPIREGWAARTHFADAAAGLWLEGGLAPLEDLTLHDARMDARAPTPEVVRAHQMLRARRRVAARAPGWALSAGGLAALRGREEEAPHENGEREADEEAGLADEEAGEARADMEPSSDEDELSALIAGADRVIARAGRALAGSGAIVRSQPPARDPPARPRAPDALRDEDERMAAWRGALDRTDRLPPTLAAAMALDAWETLQPSLRRPWLGPLLAAALLRERGKARAHLPCLNLGLRAVPRERRRSADRTVRLAARLEAAAAAAEAGLKDHDRWLTARALLLRRLEGRRSTSSLPALIDLVLSRPLVSAGMIAKELGITSRAAQDLVRELRLREATGRGRYRAWGVP